MLAQIPRAVSRMLLCAERGAQVLLLPTCSRESSRMSRSFWPWRISFFRLARSEGAPLAASPLGFGVAFMAASFASRHAGKLLVCCSCSSCIGCIGCTCSGITTWEVGGGGGGRALLVPFVWLAIRAPYMPEQRARSSSIACDVIGPSSPPVGAISNRVSAALGVQAWPSLCRPALSSRIKTAARDTAKMNPSQASRDHGKPLAFFGLIRPKGPKSNPKV